eukprot:757110-Hanusia_phi.AAC.4
MVKASEGEEQGRDVRGVSSGGQAGREGVGGGLPKRMAEEREDLCAEERGEGSHRSREQVDQTEADAMVRRTVVLEERNKEEEAKDAIRNEEKDQETKPRKSDDQEEATEESAGS